MRKVKSFKHVHKLSCVCILFANCFICINIYKARRNMSVYVLSIALQSTYICQMIYIVLFHIEKKRFCELMKLYVY